MHIKKVSAECKDAIQMMNELSAELTSITNDSGRSSFECKDIKEEQKALFVVAYEEEEPIGCGCFRKVSDDIAEIKRMYAKKKGSKIGGTILNYLEEEAKKLGYSQLVLETRKINKRAVQFYLKNEYEICSNYGRYVNREDAVCFKKQLQ